MSWFFKLLGNASNNGAEVNSSNEVLVVGNKARNEVGVFSENHDGALGAPKYMRSPETTLDYRLRVGVDTVVFNDTFNATAQNTANWKYTFTTMTMTQSAGFLNVNAAGTSTVSGNFAYLQSWRYFPLIGTAPIAAEFSCAFSELPIANEVLQWGLGIPTGAADVVDGVWFEYTSAGLKGVTRYNSGTAVKTDLVSTLSVNQVRHFTIVVGEGEIQFWVDDVLYGIQTVPVGQGQPFLTSSLPVFIQKYNSGTVGASPNLIARFGDVNVSIMDIATNQTWANQMASWGLGMQGLNGGTMGNSMVQWGNAALPAAAAATNTTAALGAFLGGIFQMNAPATSTTDVIVSSWQNPAGGVNQTPRTIKLRGIKVDCINTVAAVATTGTTFAVAVAWGAQQANIANSLAGSETGSFITATTKIRRIQPIGVISFPVGAAVGAVSSPIQFDFEAPLVVNPNEFIQVIAKPILGTATATEVFVWIISPNLYHE